MKRIIIVAFLCMLMLPSASYAVPLCREPLDMVEAYPVIFEGRVLSVRSDEAQKKINMELYKKYEPEIGAFFFVGLGIDPAITAFEVLETYKGKIGKEIEIRHLRDGRQGVSYDAGKRYIILANIDQEGRYVPSLCEDYYALDSEKYEHPRWVDALPQLAAIKAQITVYDQMIASYPNHPRLYLKKAAFLESVKDYQRAEETYKRGEQAYLQWKERTENKAADFGLGYVAGYGRALFYQKRYAEALEPLERAIKWNGDNSKQLLEQAKEHLAKSSTAQEKE
ncbi:MAG: hypothetical protein HND56_08875 [Pseudomonadota bacterium]|nr:hypothetical protein [Pseudomonadota bacterium]QKK05793.1 MAG: hypothetical protein HND56_08875 [Pseudomonadota bacterium]